MLVQVIYAGQESEANEFVFKQSINHAIVNIPKSIQNIFAKSGGKIVIADNSKEMCKGFSQAKSLEGDPNSCLVFIAAEKDHGQILHLVLPPDFVSVHHNIMRLVGMFVVDVLAIADEERKAVVSEFMTRNTIEFVEDLYQSKAFDGRKILKQVAGDDVGGRLLAARAKNGKLTLESINKALSGNLNYKNSLDFSRKVFIESFDSYYCNSWEKVNTKAYNQLQEGNLSGINKLKNTRAVMLQLFPHSYKFYNDGVKDFLGKVTDLNKSKVAATQPGAAAFSLAGFGDRLSRAWDSSTAAAGAFGKSLFWDQTTKPVLNAYSGYSQRVQNNWNNGSGIIAGYTGAAADAYKENVYVPTQERTQRVFDRQVQAGADVNTAYRNTLSVELLRPTGATAVAESAVLGERFDGSQYKDGFERASEFSFGVAGVASTAAVPLSLLPKGAVPAAPGVVPTATEASANAAALESIGVDATRAAGYGQAFEAGATTRTLPQGTSLYRVGNGKGSWFTTQPYRDPINSLALPASSEAGATNVSRVVTTRPVTVVEGGVSPQPGWATPGNPKLGGGSQVYMNYAEANGGAVRPVSLQTPVQQATIPAVGTGTVVNGAQGQ